MSTSSTSSFKQVCLGGIVAGGVCFAVFKLLQAKKEDSHKALLHATYSEELKDVSYEEFDQFTRDAWQRIHIQEGGATSLWPIKHMTREDCVEERRSSDVHQLRDTVDSENRKRDRVRVLRKFSSLSPESILLGEDDTELMVGDTKVATGFIRILFGDHGPYFELAQHQVHWPVFKYHISKGPRRHYHEHRTASSTNASTTKSNKVAMLYHQFNGVQDEPNPPPGEWSMNNERPKGRGYADYRPGVFYLAADDVTECC